MNMNIHVILYVSYNMFIIYICNDRTSNIDVIMVHSVGDVYLVVVVHSRWIRVV